VRYPDGTARSGVTLSPERGHGRFWLAAVDGRDVMVVAHRFGFALEHGVDELAAAPVLGHRCDNPLCQRIGPAHVVRTNPRENRREWAARRALAGGAPAAPRRVATQASPASTWWPRPD